MASRIKKPSHRATLAGVSADQRRCVVAGSAPVSLGSGPNADDPSVIAFASAEAGSLLVLWNKSSLFFLLGLFTFFAPLAHANGSTLIHPTPFSSTREDIQLVDEFKLSTQHESFLNRERPPSGVVDYTRVSARLRASSDDDEPVRGFLDIGGTFTMNVEKQTNFEVPQAFLRWDPEGSGVTVELGRKLEHWSRLDSQWGLGLWQPFNRFDGLVPTEQGLAGAFVGYGYDRVRVMAFVSPLFIPEQGAQFEVEDGRFITGNPWFSAPVNRYRLNSKDTDINFHIKTPSAGTVVNHPAAGGLLRYGDPSEVGPLIQLAYARKPRNQLSTPFTAIHSMPTQEGEVVVYPRVAYHRLASADVAYRAAMLNVALSGLADFPEPENLGPELNGQVLKPLYVVSPSIEVHGQELRWYLPSLRLSYLQSFGEEAEFVGPTGFSSSPFASPTIFKHAASVEIASRVAKTAEWTLDQKVKWIEEFSEQGSIIMAGLSLTTSAGWSASLSADILGSRQPVNNLAGFIAEFRGNDRVGASFTYLF